MGPFATQVANLYESGLSGFWRDYYAMTHPDPLMETYRVWTFKKGEVLIMTHLIERGGKAHFSSIMSPTHGGKGYASKVVKEITKLADKHGVTMSLFAKPFGRFDNKLDMNQLIGWYKRNGFVQEPNMSRQNLIRYPK